MVVKSRVWVSLSLAVSLTACAPPDRNIAPVVPEAASVGQLETVFFATTRTQDGDAQFGIGRAYPIRRGTANVSLPPERELGKITYGGQDPDPTKHFALASVTEFEEKSRFRSALRREIANQPNGSREVSLFVHGYNTAFDEALFRMAQMRADLEMPGTAVSYAWPSRARAVGYEYDKESVFFSRDGLEVLLRDVQASGASRIILIAHSMGSLLAMETLRQIEQSDPGWAARNLGGVVLISPDLDVGVFLSQMYAIQTIPEPFIIFSSESDRILGLSARLSGVGTRLGNIQDVSVLGDLPVTVLDVTALSESDYQHFIAGSSPALISMIQQAREVNADFFNGDAEVQAGLLGAETRVVKDATEVIIDPFR